MNDQLTTPPYAASTVLMLTGESQEERQRLLRQLNSAGIGYRLLGLLPEMAPADDQSEMDVWEFFHDFTQRLQRMTEKERLVLQRILTGQTNKSISQQLELTQRAVELRKASIMKKLGASSHTELVRLTTKHETLKSYLLRQLDEAPILRGDGQSGRTLEAVHHANGKEMSPDCIEAW